MTASFYEPGGETILQVNDELGVRVALLVPAVASVIAWLALHIACRDGFTIGTSFLPGAIALTVAAVKTPTGPPRGRADESWPADPS